MPDFAIERRCEGVVCGIDEAGRGPLAGPVVAAAVIIDRRRFRGELRYVLDDSKALSRELRESCYDALHAGLRSGIVSIGVGAASVAEIDRINVLRANLLAMRRAVTAIAARTGIVPDVALVDGNIAPSLPCSVRTVVKGDSLSLSIAAASVVAKVTRDRIMRALALRHPGYGWETQCRVCNDKTLRCDPQAGGNAAPSPFVRANSHCTFAARRSTYTAHGRPTLSIGERGASARLRQHGWELRCLRGFPPRRSVPIDASPWQIGDRPRRRARPRRRTRKLGNGG